MNDHLQQPDNPLLRVNWNHVFYFSLIASSGSIKDASTYLGLRPSTLSEHLAQLESDLEVKLFRREHRRLTLTEEGGRLYQHAKLMFDSGQRMLDVISPIPLGSYPLSVGLVPSASFELAYGQIGSYVKEYPRTSLKLLRMSHDELEKQLVDSKIDFGYTDQRCERKDVEQQLLLSSDLAFFAAMEEPESCGLLDLLESKPLFICRANSVQTSTVENLLNEYEVKFHAVVASEFPSFVVYMARTGAGVSVISRSYVQTVGLPLREVPAPKNFPKISDKLYVTWAKSSSNSAAVQHLKRLMPKA